MTGRFFTNEPLGKPKTQQIKWSELGRQRGLALGTLTGPCSSMWVAAKQRLRFVSTEEAGSFLHKLNKQGDNIKP